MNIYNRIAVLKLINDENGDAELELGRYYNCLYWRRNAYLYFTKTVKKYNKHAIYELNKLLEDYYR